jgi:hypothetical protein
MTGCDNRHRASREVLSRPPVYLDPAAALLRKAAFRNGGALPSSLDSDGLRVDGIVLGQVVNYRFNPPLHTNYGSKRGLSLGCKLSI